MKIRNIILAVSVCFALFGCKKSQVHTDGIWELNNWMSALDDTTKVCKLSIPGTHDALTACGFTDPQFIDDYTTQVATLDEQLAGGLRYFDIRLVLNETANGIILQTSHRTATICFTFSDVLSKVNRFLKDNPSEFLIMKIQYDGGDMTDSVKNQWTESVQSIININKVSFVPFRPDLTVKDLRGKILLLSRTSYGEPVCGALTNWIDEGAADYLHFDSLAERRLVLSPTPEAAIAYKGNRHPLSARLYVQDFYNTIDDRITEKLHAVEAMYQSAVNLSSEDNTWIINHVSGFSTPKMNAIGYAENASKANAHLLSLLRSDSTNHGIGIIAMDYACIDTLNQKIGTLGIINRKVMSRSLTRAIIEKNMK